MSNLENLTDKIIRDAQINADKIIAQATQEASEIIEISVDIAEKEKEKILLEAKDEAEKTAEQIIYSKNLAIRDDKLATKQVIVDKVFDYAIEKLNAMSRDEYILFLNKKLKDVALDGEEILIPSKYNIKNIDELKAILKDNNGADSLKLYSGDRDISGGFVLIKNGVENNNTFETLIQYYRYDLEGSIIENIF